MEKSKKPKIKKYYNSKELLKSLKKPRKNKPATPVFQMLIVIVNRGKAEEVNEFLKQGGVKYRIISFGEGTANSTFQNIMGLHDIEKEIISCVIPIQNSSKFLDKLENKFLLKEKNSGIAFTIPLKSITMESMEKLVKENKKNGTRK